MGVHGAATDVRAAQVIRHSGHPSARIPRCWSDRCLGERLIVVAVGLSRATRLLLTVPIVTLVVGLLASLVKCGADHGDRVVIDGRQHNV